MLRLAATFVSAVVMLWPAMSWAANSVTVESKTVYAGHAGSQIHIRLVNDFPVSGIDLPLIIREVSPGAFVTSLQLTFGDRLTLPGGPLRGVRGTWQIADTTGKCGFNGESWDPDYIDTLPHPVAGAPMDIRFVRAKSFDEDLAPGQDNSGSFILTADIGATPGQFEIDTTCVLFSHLVFAVPSGQNFLPSFTKGTITIQECSCPHHGDSDQDGFITAIDLCRFIDCMLFCDFVPPANDCPDPSSPVFSDWDCDGFPTALDLGLLVDYMFAGGSGPCDPCACDPYPDDCP
jgi:hypothetical protein